MSRGVQLFQCAHSSINYFEVIESNNECTDFQHMWYIVVVLGLVMILGIPTLGAPTYVHS